MSPMVGGGSSNLRIVPNVVQSFIEDLPLSAVGTDVVTSASALDARDVLGAQGRLVVSVSDHGALGNGVADDTVAIHAARTAAGVGGTVHFPKGTYLVGGLTASVAGQTWQFGSGAVVKMKSGAAECLSVTADGVTVEGGTFDASNGTLHDWSQHGVLVTGDDFTIRDSTVSGSPKMGIRALNCDRVRVVGCTFTENYDGAVFIQNSLAAPSTTSDHMILNNRVESSSARATGFVVRGESTSRTVSRVTVAGNHVRLLSAPDTVDPACLAIISGVDYVVDGNVFEGGSFGITNPDTVRGTITGNIIRGFHKIGIELPGVCQNTTVTGNVIDADFSVDGVYVSNGDTGIIFSNGVVSNLTVTGNSISGFSESNSIGVSFGSGTVLNGGVVSGNTISSTMVSGPFSALYFNSSPTDLSIIGNVIDGSSASSTYGVNMTSGATGLLVSGNQFSNLSVNPLNLSSSGGGPYTDVRFTGNVVRNCGVAVGGAGATSGTRIVTDTVPLSDSTPTSAGTTALTVGSAEVQVFTGSTTHTCVLPTTSVLVGQRFMVVNSSTGVVTVNASGGTTVATLAGGAVGTFVALQSIPTTNAHWAHDLKVLSNSQVSALRDTNGNTGLALGPTASAVNHIQLTNAAAGSSPTIEPAGSDANVNVQIRGRGTGGVFLVNSGSVPIARFWRVSSAVNYWDFEQSAAGQPLKVYPTGSDANISVNVVPKGTGTLQVNANPVGVKVAVPGTATAAGAPGQWAADATYFYVCTATNTWVRSALATW